MTFADDAWALVNDRKALEARVAAEGEAGAVALARLSRPSNDLAIAISEEGSAELMGPLLVAAMLAADDARTITSLLSQLRPCLSPRVLPHLHALLTKADERRAAIAAKGKDPWGAQAWGQAAVWCAGLLARAGDTKEAELRAKEAPALYNPLLSQHLCVREAIEELALPADPAEGELRTAQYRIEAFANSGIRDAVPAILPWLRTGIAAHALAALARLGPDPRAMDAARHVARETHGELVETSLLVLAAEAVLAQEPGAKRSLDLARAALAIRQPRYGIPKPPELTLLRRLASEALLDAGGEADRPLVARLVFSADDRTRALAKRAGAPEKLVVWDAGRVAWAGAQPDGTKRLLAALDDPAAIGKHAVIKALAEVDDADTKLALARRTRAEIERETGKWVDSEHECDPVLSASLRAASTLAEDKAARAAFEGATHEWILAGVLETQKPGYARALPASPRPVTARNLDAPPYFFPDGVDLVALAAEAERVVVVGPKQTVVLDPRASARVTSIDGTATACAISPDGARVALARGAGVALFDGATGAATGTLDVAGGALALAFSADGGALAAGGEAGVVHAFDLASGKALAAIEVKGPVRAVAWGGPKRVVALADAGAKSAAWDLDVGKKKATSAELPARMTKLATIKKLALVGGGSKALVLDGKLATKVELAFESEVGDVVLETDKVALVRTQHKTVRVSFGGKAPKHEDAIRSATTGLAAGGGRLYAPCDRTVFRWHQDPEGKVAKGVHYNHPTAIVPLPDGRIATAAWDGRILLWTKDGGVAETLAERGKRVDDLGVDAKGEHLYFNDEHSVRRLAIATKAVDAVVGGDDIDEDLRKLMPKVVSVAASGDRLAWGDNTGTVHCVRLPDGEELWNVKLGPDDVECLAFDAEGNVYGGCEKGWVGAIGKDGATLWSRVEHGIDCVDGRLVGNPHRDVAAVAARGTRVATLASDHTVRVFDGPTGKRALRFFRPVGIFDKVAFSPSGKLLAFTWGGYCEIVDAETGALAAFHDGNALPGAKGAGWGATLMTVAWLDEATLLIGAETGRHQLVTLG